MVLLGGDESFLSVIEDDGELVKLSEGLLEYLGVLLEGDGFFPFPLLEDDGELVELKVPSLPELGIDGA